MNTPGIFEHTVPPGRYLLEVEKENYETIRKFIDLEKGFNSINVEMSIERCCNLHIFVYNYEKFQEELYIPIHNVDVVIYQNSNEVLEETITNNKGEVNYLVNKGDYWQLEGPELYTSYLRIIGYPDSIEAIDPPGGPFMSIGDTYSGKKIVKFEWEDGIGTKIYLEDETN